MTAASRTEIAHPPAGLPSRPRVSPPPPAVRRARPRLRDMAVSVLALLIVGALGAIHLPHPFHGDKALYQLGARVLTDGGILYVDFWDLKKPGIYLFHAIAGKLFGFSEVGVHLFELLYFLALSTVLIRAVRPHLAHPGLAPVAPLVTVGAYYCVVSGWHLTQPAVIALVPLFLTIWPASTDWDSRTDRLVGFFLSGLAAGCALLVKVEMLPIALGSWLLATGLAVRGGERALAAAATRLGPALAGAALVLGIAALWFAVHGALAQFLWATVGFPAGAWRLDAGRDISRLLESGRWFVLSFAPPLALATLLPLGWRGVQRERFTLEMVMWLCMGAVSIVLEPYAWWAFDFLVLVLPVGMLALRGTDGLVTWLERRGSRSAHYQAIAAVALLVAFVPAMRLWVRKARPLAAAWATGDARWVRRYQAAIDPQYEVVERTMGFLHAPDALPGAIYVLGNPLYQLYSERPQAIAMNGWAWEVLPDDQWTKLAAELEAAAPAYIYISASYLPLVRTHAPRLLAWLGSAYTAEGDDDRGTWYRRAATR